MKFGFRTPSLRKRIAARTSWKRVVRHSWGLKAPRGWGWVTDPKRAAYNRIYNRTTFGLGRGCLVSIVVGLAGCALVVAAVAFTLVAGSCARAVQSREGYVEVTGGRVWSTMQDEPAAYVEAIREFLREVEGR